MKNVDLFFPAIWLCVPLVHQNYSYKRSNNNLSHLFTNVIYDCKESDNRINGYGIIYF